ncbi:MAG: hypothetical protein OQL08_09005 [Gammaproteobacteria bacterium]|nr:hypothetical protein [Gammaproteobacteria bacterium]
MSAHVHSTLHGARAAQAQRLPVAGKIRPGIKVLTAKARAIHGAQQAYNDGLAAGVSFDDIEKRLKQISGMPAYPLTPRNAPYFRVVPDDFTTPGAAEAILQRYADPKDGLLYTFPVIFPADDLNLIFREGFEAWKASELSFWSEPDPQTGELLCKKRQEITADKTRRKRWGGRPVETVGPCDPNGCDVFGNGNCMHHGSLYFYVPGCPGVGLIELQFTSIYASLGIGEVLELVHHGLGHIKGTHNGEPIFWISKRRQEVSRIDWEKGKAERTDQYIISIEARGLDMAQVFAQQEMGTAPQLAAPAKSSGALPDLSNEEREAPGTGELMEETHGELQGEVEIEQEQAAEPTPAASAAPTADNTKDIVKALRAEAFALVKKLGIDAKLFGERMSADLGDEWSTNMEALDEAITRLTEATQSGDTTHILPPVQEQQAAAASGKGAPF